MTCRRRLLLRMLAAPALLGVCLSAAAVDYQVHGYAAQGFVYSDDNNVFGKSSDGSWCCSFVGSLPHCPTKRGAPASDRA